LYIDREQAWLVSRKGKKFRQFDPLLKQVLRCLKGQRAILGGRMVVLDAEGRSNFFDLMAHRGEPRYYVFDLLWLNRIDLREEDERFADAGNFGNRFIGVAVDCRRTVIPQAKTYSTAQGRTSPCRSSRQPVIAVAKVSKPTSTA